jgi:hypothetical protein
MTGTQYSLTPKCFHLDNETSIGCSFDNWAASKGILVQRSAPYSPQQNGVAERAGLTLVERARTMRIHANLPETLWPEAIKTAVYMTNHCLIRLIDWKTLYESHHAALGLPKAKPSLGHLRTFGCRTYAHLPKIPRLQKLAARAQLGYLVGYELSNMYASGSHASDESYLPETSLLTKRCSTRPIISSTFPMLNECSQSICLLNCFLKLLLHFLKTTESPLHTCRRLLPQSLAQTLTLPYLRV